MHNIIITSILLVAFVLFGIIEYYIHQKRIYSIPIRIHVNGTRGKSSVARLIGAGMCGGGVPTLTKITGTEPYLILENGIKMPINRKGFANVIEQLGIVKFAQSRNVKALVIECMALVPAYQWLTENRMIHSTIGVMTNIRIDHTDVMGKTLADIALSLGNTVPDGRQLFTADAPVHNEILKIAKKRNTKIHYSDAESVSDNEMNRFSYIEHKENVALALSVCENVGVGRDVALQAMYESEPDSGALKRYTINFHSRVVTFYNAFAANDAESTLIVWNKLKADGHLKNHTYILLNSRNDRLYRSFQLIDMVCEILKNDFKYLILIGDASDVLGNLAVKNGISQNRIIAIGITDAATVFEKTIALIKGKASIVAVGNTGGIGLEVVSYFEHRSIQSNG